jgi:ribose/xylose/arabinose/galactoside ABC-type transport system permease subunit
MKNLHTNRFSDQKEGFRQILSDPHWLAKVLLGGFLLINPFLVAFAPAYFSGKGPDWVREVFPWILGFNVLSFWFPLGFTYEVLRRARTGRGAQLPDWEWNRLAVFAKEGAVKLVIAVFTLLIPAAVGMGAIYGVFMRLLGLPDDLVTLAIPPIMLFVIPFCGIACCRWLDGASVLDAALNYPENIRLFRKGCPDYLIAAAFIIGVNSITTAFFYTIPFGAVFGLCLVDTWFGPIYAESVARHEEKLQPKREPALAER